MGWTDPIFDDNVWIMDIDGKNKTRLSKSKFYDGSPAFSPDGTKVIFESAPKKLSAVLEIWTMNIEGSDQKQITMEEIQKPSWSPKGTKKVFKKHESESYEESGGEGTEEWWERSGSREKIITRTITYARNACTHPSWSPDGKKLSLRIFIPSG